MNKTTYLISVIGPTAIGKTALSIALANFFETEILSADSRQFYREMQIGTAAPTKNELSAAPHHFIHHKSIKDIYNVGTFEKDALQRLEALYKKYNVVVMVSGSGLYIDAVVNGLDEFPDIDKSIRAQLNNDLENLGLATLQERLKTLDPEAFNTLALENPHRVIRALEVCIGTARPYSSFLNKNKTKRDFKTITIGLSGDREDIYHRINQRVDLMLEEGLVEEAKGLIQYRHLNALNTVGYKELFQYFDGTWSLEFAVSEIKKNTRRFAKRQLTWFKKNEDTLWFDYKTPKENILNAIKTQIKKPT